MNARTYEVNPFAIDEVRIIPVGAYSSGGGLSDEAKQAILTAFQHVAWIDEHGQDYIDAIEEAFYPPATLLRIQAVYTQSGTVYPTDSLDSLKPDLVVTAVYTDSSTETVTTYTLSGTLTVGQSTITVSYGGKTTTFKVNVTATVELVSISAAYTQSGNVYPTTDLDDLKDDLIVVAVWSDSTQTTLSDSDYTLSGTLDVGTSTINATYAGKSGTFNVTVIKGVDVAPSLSTFVIQNSTYGAVTYDSTADSLRIYTKSNHTYVSAKVPFTTEEGYEYLVEYDLAYTSGAHYSQFTNSSNTGVRPPLAYNVTENAHISEVHEHASTIALLHLYVTWGTAVAGDLTITNFHIYKRPVAKHQLYSLENRSFDTEVIDTGLTLLDEDKSFSIAFDANVTSNPTSGDASTPRFVSVVMTDGSGYSLAIAKGTATAGNYSLVWMGSNTQINNSSVGTGRMRFVVTHRYASDEAVVAFRKDDGSKLTATVSVAFTASTNHLTFGQGVSSKNNHLPTGTINKAYVYDYVMTTDEINAFLGL